MRALAATVLAGFIALAVAVPAVGEEVEAQPYELVRTLQRMQDQIAAGSTAAHTGQRALLKLIEERFMAAPATVWQEPRNARAAVVYLLSGGQPSVIRHLLGFELRPNVDERLLLGALAYVEGREDEARSLLQPVAPRGLAPGLGGQIALVKAALLVRDKPAEAMEMLAVARLLMPGTLVEEAAMRREIFVASQLGDLDRFEMLAERYMRRYRHSVYAGNFQQRFAAALTRLDFTKDRERFGRLDGMLSSLDPATRRDLYLLVSRASVYEGRIEAAIHTAQQALALSPPGEEPAERARLYQAAAMIVTEAGYDEARAELRRIDRTRLSAADVELLDIAQGLARHIRQWPAALPEAAEPDEPIAPAPQATADPKAKPGQARTGERAAPAAGAAAPGPAPRGRPASAPAPQRTASPPAGPRPAVQAEEPARPAPVPTSVVQQPTPTITRAQELIGAVDALLEGVQGGKE
ncbi:MULTISPECIES: hypothetical protein [unclassified Chelatococcus]|uniref:hypothetical protein n=1 Tax=unclassified Chelatococcus TaxID=2638111 RepID=UPI0002F8F2B8|nr:MULTISPECIES: hypothetical protein [unclassified Chelatococcus]